MEGAGLVPGLSPPEYRRALIGRPQGSPLRGVPVAVRQALTHDIICHTVSLESRLRTVGEDGESHSMAA